MDNTLKKLESERLDTGKKYSSLTCKGCIDIKHCKRIECLGKVGCEYYEKA